MKRVARAFAWGFIFSTLFMGCTHPTETSHEWREISMAVTGDAPLYIEYSYVNGWNGENRVGSCVKGDATIPQSWNEGGLTMESYSFRLYATCILPKGHVKANVHVSALEGHGNFLLSEVKENDGGAVEITGIVP